jgi:hypothetical protein
LLFSVLYGFWVANLVAFNGDVMRELAVQFLALAKKQTATGPLMMGHRLMGLSLLHTGDVVEGRAHLDRAITFYDPAEHRPLATRFGQDIGAATLSWKSLAHHFIPLGATEVGAKPVTALQGTPPKRVRDSYGALKAWFNGADYQAALKIGEKYATFRRFAVEGQ